MPLALSFIGISFFITIALIIRIFCGPAGPAATAISWLYQNEVVKITKIATRQSNMIHMFRFACVVIFVWGLLSIGAKSFSAWVTLSYINILF